MGRSRLKKIGTKEIQICVLHVSMVSPIMIVPHATQYTDMATAVTHTELRQRAICTKISMKP
jgi:hypothetical protein